MNGLAAWLLAQVNIAGTVVSAVITNKPAPARQVLIYTLALAALAVIVPKIVKLVGK